MAKTYHTEPIIRVSPPKKTDIIAIRFLISCGLLCMLVFVLWFFRPEHIGFGPIYWLLTFALIFKLVKMIHEWYHYWSPSIPVPPVSTRQWTVDILTTACPGEPRDMIIRTLHAMVAIRYPHTNYLCDEGNDPELKRVCDELGIVHVTRIEKTNAKAGNINNALKQATGEICVVLDPDHEPIPEFLDRTLPFFEDEKIGFVQCVQGYYNQSESIIARGAAEQTYHFYGPMMMCMNTYGTVQAIGANCTFRRKALDSIGGHAPGLSEDMHTAMQLHAKGWKSVYIPEMLTRGLVPATLSSYYKQQLKWSRGTFELLFRTYPSLYKNFTWRQKIHYFTIPLYFLFGLINFIDILIPVLALCMARVPWEVDIQNFASLFIPLCVFSMFIRLFAQRWLLEKHERGFHFAGGILRTATWWIFLVGFIYSIFNIKVPYIPTPKEDEHRNYWTLSLPNFGVFLVCGLAIWYGLSIDWSPYSIAMAAYALINAGILCLIAIMSQQKLLLKVFEFLHSYSLYNYIERFVSNTALLAQKLFYGTFRNAPLALVASSSFLLLSYSSINGSDEAAPEKDTGGFYTGIHLGSSVSPEAIGLFEKATSNTCEIVAVDRAWGAGFMDEKIIKVTEKERVIMINWLLPSHSDSIYGLINEGECDAYLGSFSAEIRKYADPVFICFAPWFDAGKQSPEEFVKAWHHVFGFFRKQGISNITWVWNPRYSSSLSYYPGSFLVDWIQISCPNGDKKQLSFSDLYEPFHNKLDSLQKPVMIGSFGTSAGAGQKKWFGNALGDIGNKYKEIKALVFSGNKKDKRSGSKKRKENSYGSDFTINFWSTIAAGLKKEPFNQEPLLVKPVNPLKADLNYRSAFITGKPGKFSLMVEGKPYYIKGVAYNPGHDWRDGNTPLARRQLEKDFSLISAMGANTIRRYSHGMYDKNVLNVAGEYKLKVLYGFWFDPKIDYYKDSVRVKQYIKEVEENVLKFKDHPSVLAWSIGNETWGLLKHRFTKPYLTKVRQYYVGLIEHLARRIHELDPSHPVFSCMEHEESWLPGELAAYHDAAPSIDVIGINSYYKEQISTLHQLTWQFDSLRPYLVSEFGPSGYWNSNYNNSCNGSLVEEKEYEKAEWYKEQWFNYVLGHRGRNIGGFAYCWHDRMEGSNTWFGLSDYKGRVKPSYYSLKKAWTGYSPDLLPQFTIQSPGKLQPGKEYEFIALANKRHKGELNYEWHLRKDEYLDKVDNISDADEKKVKVMIPEEASEYRLYLYVSDTKGNVSTASLPVKVK